MTQIKVDHSTTLVSKEELGQTKLKDILHRVNTGLPDNRIITKVFIDGQPLNQENDRLEKELAGITEVEIRTADILIWKQTGLDIALSCLERVQTSLSRTAELFRASDMGRANRFFAQCIEGLERFLEAMTISRYAMKLDFNKIDVNGYTLAQIESSLSAILKSVLMSQEEKAFDDLADKIEDELVTNLASWKRAISQIQELQR